MVHLGRLLMLDLLAVPPEVVAPSPASLSPASVEPPLAAWAVWPGERLRIAARARGPLPAPAPASRCGSPIGVPYGLRVLFAPLMFAAPGRSCDPRGAVGVSPIGPPFGPGVVRHDQRTDVPAGEESPDMDIMTVVSETGLPGPDTAPRTGACLERDISAGPERAVSARR
jgi:hypothetical protein